MTIGALESDIERILVAQCVRDLAAHRLPPLYESGVRYQREPAGSEMWDSAATVAARGYGDCEDLAAWRVAELRLAGEEGAEVAVVRTGPKTLHALVRRGDGSWEDPSAELGMRRGQEGVHMPRMLAGIEDGDAWVAFERRAPGRGIVTRGPTLTHAVLGAGAYELGAGTGIPVVDTIARAAGGALSAVLPGGQVDQRTASRVASSLAVEPSEVLEVAAQLARIVSAEKRRAVAESKRAR